MPDKMTFKGGLDLKFFTNSEFESLEHVAPEEHASIIGRNALRLLMMGWPQSWTQLLTWPTIKAVFVKRDPHLLKELRLAFQQGFETLFTQLQGKKFNKEEHEQIQLYLSNCLSLLPYSDLTPYESIKIPQYVNDEWTLVEYHITPIELTPKKGIRKLFLHDTDRVFAYGLEPLTNELAKSHLIFMGTTYPAGQGFIPQINTDFKGFETVGNSLYQSGRERIKRWLSRQNDKVEVSGVSLGGSLSLLLAIDLGEHLSRVDALNPAGLHEYHIENDHWEQMKCRPRVVIQKQGNDPVSLFGIWKKEWEILRITPPKDKAGANPFLDHFLNYAGFAETEFTYVSAEQENLERKIRNFWLYTIGRNLIYYAALLPYSYVARPFLYFMYNHWLAALLGFVSLIAITATAGLMVFGIIPIAVSLGICAVLGAINSFLFLSCVVSELLLMKNSIAKVIVQQRESSATDGSYSVDDEDAKLAKLHDPSLPRNASMDMYDTKQKIEVNLTHKELNTYYKMMRCLVKNKEFIPNEEKPAKHFNGLFKKQLLLATQDPEKSDVVLTLQTTKAKAVHIKRTLTLVDELSSENESVLKNALEQEYKHYCVGRGNVVGNK